MTTLTDRLRKLSEFVPTPGKGPCLIPRKGVECALVCHERDFCECDLRAENARLRPLLDALLECVEALETYGRDDFYGWLLANPQADPYTQVPQVRFPETKWCIALFFGPWVMGVGA